MRQEKNGCKTSVGSIRSISSHSSTSQDVSEHDLQVIPPAWLVLQHIRDGVQPANSDASMGRAQL